MAVTSRWLPRIMCMGSGNRQLALFLFPSSLPSSLCLSLSVSLYLPLPRQESANEIPPSAALCKAASSGQPWAALLSFLSPCRPSPTHCWPWPWPCTCRFCCGSMQPCRPSAQTCCSSLASWTSPTTVPSAWCSTC